MLAAVHTTGLNAELVAAILAPLLTALAGGTWRLAKIAAKFSAEHTQLMTDLKRRTENLERATPGIHPLPESVATIEARNGH